MPLHPAWVKNISRRVLWAALEPDISKAERTAMAAFFRDCCAYCEGVLGNRWHADHLVAVDAGGFNHRSNRVPACPRCNEHEKRDMPWEKFLEAKANGDIEVLRRRRQTIDNWMGTNKPPKRPVSDEQRAAWSREVAAVAEAIDNAWKRLKSGGAG